MPTIQRPNLLYIHTDQHNPSVTGCYGDPLVATPNLDRLAANGARFENVYCPSPICVPSRDSFSSRPIILGWPQRRLRDSRMACQVGPSVAMATPPMKQPLL